MGCTFNLLTSPCMAQHNNIKSNYITHYYKSTSDLPYDWNTLALKKDIFLSITYLHHIEENSQDDMEFRYVSIYNNKNEIAAVVYFQMYPFRADRSLNNTMKSKHGIATTCKQVISKLIGFDTLLCGNIYLTGEHGFLYDLNKISLQEFMVELNKIIDNVQADFQALHHKPLAVIVKDFYVDNNPYNDALVDAGFVRFQVQPNMVMNIRENWHTFDDYLADFHSKARTRVNRALKKMSGVQVIPLTKALAASYSDKIEQLHRQVVDDSSFNTVKVTTDYKINLIEILPDNYEMLGFFEGDNLISFCTYFIDDKKLIAHFLGFEKSLNHDKQLYLNMLLQMVKKAIDKKCNRIIFARTAMEIKSSIGAEAYQMDCYIRHSNYIMNKMAQPIFKFLSPKYEWTPRHPFKN